MDGFKQFYLIEVTKEQEKDIKASLNKLPKKYRDLIKGYKFKFQIGNTLKGNDNHVGIINSIHKTITIAAPWRYGREFTFLHELGHKVWAELVDANIRKEWSHVVKKNKDRDKKENDEENFCHAFACHYSKNKILKHHHPAWDKFIEKIVK